MFLKEYIIKKFKKHEEFIIFITGGGVGALIKWILTFIITSIIGIHYLIAYTVAEIVNVFVNFTWHTLITFKVTDDTPIRLFRFILLSSVTFSINFSLVYFVKEFILDKFVSIIVWGKDLNYLAAVIIITFVISILNYFVSKIWVFNEKK